MNWKQIYTTLTPAERIEAAILILQTIEARKRRLVFTGARFIRERRRPYPSAHYINNRRNRWRLIPKMTIAFILATLTAGLLIVSLNIPASYAVPLNLIYQTCIIALLYLKPARRLQTAIART